MWFGFLEASPGNSLGGHAKSNHERILLYADSEILCLDYQEDLFYVADIDILLRKEAFLLQAPVQYHVASLVSSETKRHR